jgi:hypothetical protein
MNKAGWSAQMPNGVWGHVWQGGGAGSAGAVATVLRAVQRRESPQIADLTSPELAELHGSVAALARSMSGDFDPGRFLEGLSLQLRRFISHDRLIVAYLEEGGRTLSVLEEHIGSGRLRHGRRYPCDEIDKTRALAGQPDLVRHFPTDPQRHGAETTSQDRLTAGL